MIHVIKIGGAKGLEADAVLDDIAQLWRDGERLILVHGGSDDTNQLALAMGHEPQMVMSPSGHTSRRTDRTMVEIFATATAGLNRRIVEGLRRRGVNAFGLSGLDGGLMLAERKDTIRIVEDGRQRILRDEWTGKLTSVDSGLLDLLHDRGYLPVIAPLAGSSAGEMLNVDADRAAAIVAASVGAHDLALMTNVAGLLRDIKDPSSLVRHVRQEDIPEAMDLAEGRMRKKVLGAMEALEGGVATVIIGDGRGDNPVTRALNGEGTVFGVLPSAAPAPCHSGSQEAEA